MASDAKLTVHNLLFNYLRILGMDTEALSAKHRTTFDRSMFSKPNRKAFEIVVHFLFTKLDAERTQREFRDAWPVFDKKQEAQFRKTVQAWLTEIQSKTTYFPRINPAILLSPGGDKFCELLCYLAHYVVDAKLVHDDTTLLHPEQVKGGHYASSTVRIISSSLAENLSRLEFNQERFLSEYAEKKRLANKLITESRQSYASIIALTQKLQNVKDTDPKIGERLLNLEDTTICDELLLKTQENHLKLEEEINKLRLLRSEEKESWKVLEFLFEKKSTSVQSLDGLAVLEKIPTEVLEDFQRKQTLHRKEIALTEGNVNIVDLMRLLTTVKDYCSLPPVPDNLNEHAERLRESEQEHRGIVEQLAKKVKRLESLREKQNEHLNIVHNKLAETISEGGLALPPVTPCRPLLPDVQNTPETQPELFRMTPAIAGAKPVLPAKKSVLQREVREFGSANGSPVASSPSSASSKAPSQSSLAAKHYAPDLQKQWQIKKQQQNRCEEGKPSKLPVNRKYAGVTSKIKTSMGDVPKKSPIASKSSLSKVKATEQQKDFKQEPDIKTGKIEKLQEAAENIVSSILSTAPDTSIDSPIVVHFINELHASESPFPKDSLPVVLSVETDLLQLIDSALSTPGRRSSSSLSLGTPGTTPNSRTASRWLTSSRKSSITTSDSNGTPTSSIFDKRGSLPKLEEDGDGKGEKSLDDIISRFKRVKASGNVPLSPTASFSPLRAAVGSTPTSVTPLKIPNLYEENEGTRESDNFEKINSSMFDLSMDVNLDDIEELLDASSILL